MRGSFYTNQPVQAEGLDADARAARHYEVRTLAAIAAAAQRNDTAEVLRLAALLGPSE
jgi:hypothetical protein